MSRHHISIGIRVTVPCTSCWWCLHSPWSPEVWQPQLIGTTGNTAFQPPPMLPSYCSVTEVPALLVDVKTPADPVVYQFGFVRWRTAWRQLHTNRQPSLWPVFWLWAFLWGWVFLSVVLLALPFWDFSSLPRYTLLNSSRVTSHTPRFMARTLEMLRF